MGIVSGQAEMNPGEEHLSASIHQIYKDVSGENASQIDWARVRSYFAADAIVVLRTSATATRQFTVDGFIRDFQDFYENPVVKGNGFKEEVIALDAEVYKEMAFVKVVYEATILNTERPPQRGLDYWLMVQREGTWKVLAVTNEILSPGEELPAGF